MYSDHPECDPPEGSLAWLLITVLPKDASRPRQDKVVYFASFRALGWKEYLESDLVKILDV